jgi:RNA polymerase sigma-70 factor, ECF subfamily
MIAPMAQATSDKNQNELILLAQTGNDAAFEQLVQANINLVYGICMRYLGNPEEAEDAVQESFLKIWKNLWKVDIKRNFRVWAAEIAKNTCLDILRRQRTVPLSSFENDNGENYLENTIESAIESPAQSAERSLLRRLLGMATARLSPAYQKVLALYYQEGLNFREIAEKLGEPLHTIKSRHRRAVMNLRLILAKNKE